MTKKFRILFLAMFFMYSLTLLSCDFNGLIGNITGDKEQEASVLFMVDDELYHRITLKEGEIIEKPANPTKEGYKFVGWYSDYDLTNKYDFTKAVSGGNLILYAKFEKLGGVDPQPPVDVYYTVTFYVDGVAYYSQNVLENTTYSIPANPTKEGYEFIGWYYNGSLVSTPINVTSNIALEARFEEIKAEDVYYNVTYIVDGVVYDTHKVLANQTMSGLPTPTKEGYNFVGWIHNGNLWEETNKVTANIILIARFEEVIKEVYYTVEFKVDGLVYDAQKVLEKTSYKFPANPEKEGYKFIGWYYNGQYWDFETPVTCDMVIEAKFEEIKVEDVYYTVTYVVDGVVYDTHKVLKDTTMSGLPTPTKEGYNFVGWIHNGNLWNESNKVTENITLIARFEEIIPFIFNEYEDHIEITGYIGKDINVVIPSEINDKPVTYIMANTFKDCVNIVSIDIPDTVNKIDDNLFTYSETFEWITIPKQISYFTPISSGTKLDIIYYKGTESDWNNNYNAGPAGCAGSTIYYLSQTEPTTVGNYWHYVNGEPAAWDIELCTLTLMVDNEVYKTIDVIPGQTITLNYGPTKENHHLWWTDELGYIYYENEEITVNQNTVLTANYHIYECLVEYMFEYNGVTHSNQSICSYGETIELLPATLEGYEFIGWYKDAEYTDEVEAVEYQDTTITLYGKFEEIPYTFVEYEDYIEITGYKGNEFNVVIPDYIYGKPVTIIGEYSLDHSGFKSVTIGNNVERIEQGAFAVNAIVELYISASVTYIANDAFIDSTKLDVIVVDENNNIYDSRENCNAIIETVTNKLIKGIPNTIIPNTVEIIGENAFAFIGYSYEGQGNTLSVILPSSVTTIESNAFADSGFSTLYYEGSKSDSYYVKGLDELSNITVCPNESWNLVEGKPVDNILYDNGYYYIENEQAYLEGLKDTVDFVIPSNINGYPVVQFNEKAFWNHVNATVYFEGTEEEWNNINRLDNPWRVLFYVEHLYNEYGQLNIPEYGDYWHYVGETPTLWFDYKDNFYYIDNGTYYLLGKYDGYSESVVVPENLTNLHILKNTFNNPNGENIKELIIPNNVSRMDFGALNGCNQLETLTVPFIGCFNNENQVDIRYMFIDGDDFNVPTTLKKITVTDENVIECQWYENPYIEEVVYNAPLTRVGLSSISTCPDIKQVILPADIEYLYCGYIGENTDINYYYNGTYSDFQSITIDGDINLFNFYCYSEIEPTTEGNYWHYVDGEPVVWPEYNPNLYKMEIPQNETQLNSKMNLNYTYSLNPYTQIVKYGSSSYEDVIFGEYQILLDDTMTFDGSLMSYRTSIGFLCEKNAYITIYASTISGLCNLKVTQNSNDVSISNLKIDGVNASKFNELEIGKINKYEFYIERGSNYYLSASSKGIVIYGFLIELENVPYYQVNYSVDGSIYCGEVVRQGDTTISPMGYPAKEGYNFIGWYYNGQLWNHDTPVTSDMVLEAMYEEISKHTVMFMVDGEVYQTLEVIDGQSVSFDNVPTKEGYSFVNWLDNSNNEYYLNNEYTFTSDITLTANFYRYRYNIDYVFEYEGVTNNNPTTFNVGETIILEDAALEGYSFEGWYFDSEYTKEYQIVGNDIIDVTVYGKFKVIPFTFNEYEGYIEITGYIGERLEVIIPDYINDKPVTKISYFGDHSPITNLKIGSNVKEISSNAFYVFSELKELYIPANVEKIGLASFNDTYSLEKIIVDENNKVYDSRDNCNAIIETATNRLIKGVSNTVIPNTVTSIASHAYSYSNVNNLILPNSINNIEENAFEYCFELNTVYFEGSEEEWSNVIVSSGNDLITNSTIYYYLDTTTNYPSSYGNYWHYIDGVPTEVFKQEGDFIYWIIPDIECSELALYTGSDENVIIPDNFENAFLYSIYTGTFKDNNNIQSIRVNGQLRYHSIDNCLNLEYLIISSGCVMIDSNAIVNCDNLSTIYYEGTEEKWNQDFYPYISSSNEWLDNCTIYYLSEEEPTTEGNYWHYVDGVLTVWPEYSPFTYNEYDDYIEITKYIGTDEVVEIPSELNGKPVTHIASNILLAVTSVFPKTIIIPNSVTYIAEGALSTSPYLEELVVPFIGDTRDNTTKNLGYIFENRSNTNKYNTLKKITITDMETIPSGALSNCSAQTISFGEGVKVIGEYACDHSSIIDLIIGDSIERIEAGAFAVNCIESIYIGENVNYIANDAFIDSTRLDIIVVDENNKVYDSRNDCNAIIETVTNKLIKGVPNTVIPDTVTTIGENAFAFIGYSYEGQIDNSYIVLPSSVTTIEQAAFSGCEIENVYFEGSEEEWSNVYSEHEGMVYFYSEEEPTTEGNYWHYVNGVVSYVANIITNPGFEVYQTNSGNNKFVELKEGATFVNTGGIFLPKLISGTDYIESYEFDAVTSAKVEMLAGTNTTNFAQIFKVEALDINGNVVKTVYSAPSAPNKLLGYMLDENGNKYIEIKSDVEFVKIRISSTGDKYEVGDGLLSGKYFSPAIINITYNEITIW